MLNCYQELEKAVKEDNYAKVRALLCGDHRLKINDETMLKNTLPHSSVDITGNVADQLYHHQPASDITSELLLHDAVIVSPNNDDALQAKDTLLHWTFSVKITRELLLNGARVNSLNKSEGTPLHSAIIKGKKFELVRELLKHGAHVNATTRSGHTPLQYALQKKTKKLDVIKLLLQYGADFYLRELAYDARLVRCVDVAKVLMKMTVIQNFDRVRRTYSSRNIGMELWAYKIECIAEVIYLKNYKIVDNLSLYEFLIIRNLYITPGQARTKLNEQEILTLHPIYQDLILDKLKSCIKRSALMDKLLKLEFYIKSSCKQVEKNVILNFDSTYNIVKYICNDDLENLIVAFYKGSIPLNFSGNGDINKINGIDD